MRRRSSSSTASAMKRYVALRDRDRSPKQTVSSHPTSGLRTQRPPPALAHDSSVSLPRPEGADGIPRHFQGHARRKLAGRVPRAASRAERAAARNGARAGGWRPACHHPAAAALLAMLVPVAGERLYRSLENDLDAAYASLQPYYAALDNLSANDRAFLRQRVADRVASATQRRAYFALFRGYFGWMLLKGRGARRRAALLDVPTTYIWGAEDRIVSLTAGEAARGQHTAARLQIVAGAGHLPHQEAPAEFLRILRAATHAAAVNVR